MRPVSFPRSLLVVFACWVVLQPWPAWACAVCFGKSDSPLAQGMNMGIFTLLGFVVFMWIAVGSFFIFLARRKAKISHAPQSESVRAEQAPELSELIAK